MYQDSSSRMPVKASQSIMCGIIHIFPFQLDLLISVFKEYESVLASFPLTSTLILSFWRQQTQIHISFFLHFFSPWLFIFCALLIFTKQMPHLCAANSLWLLKLFSGGRNLSPFIKKKTTTVEPITFKVHPLQTIF